MNMKMDMNTTSHGTPTPWAQHLADPAACLAAPLTTLSGAEAQRVLRHRDRLMAALRANDRVALLGAKDQVLAEAFDASATGAACSPALRRALRDLSWRMAGLLLPRGARH